MVSGLNVSLGLLLTVPRFLVRPEGGLPGFLTVPRFLVRPEGELPGVIRQPFGPPPGQTLGVSATPGQCEDGSRCIAAATQRFARRRNIYPFEAA